MVNINWENNSELILPKDYMELFPEPLSRHLKLAREVLIKTNRLLLKNNFVVLKSDTNYHIVTIVDSVGLFSLYCGGFTKRIDMQKLRCDGNVDKTYEELGFLTPEGAVNKLLKYRKERGVK